MKQSQTKTLTRIESVCKFKQDVNCLMQTMYSISLTRQSNQSKTSVKILICREHASVTDSDMLKTYLYRFLHGSCLVLSANSQHIVHGVPILRKSIKFNLVVVYTGLVNSVKRTWLPWTGCCQVQKRKNKFLTFIIFPCSNKFVLLSLVGNLFSTFSWQTRILIRFS